MSITQDDFKKIWASTSSVPEYTFSDTDYQNGWEFVGNLPPTRAMWDTLQRRNDQKMKYLQNNGSMCFDSVADMVSTDIDEGQTVITNGYYSVNDGGSALYTIRAKDVADVDDGGSIIFLDNGNVAELIADGTVCPEQFGAVGDGVTGDTTAVQNMFNFALAKFLNVVAEKTYLMSDTITVQNTDSVKTKTVNICGKILSNFQDKPLILFVNCNGWKIHVNAESSTANYYGGYDFANVDVPYHYGALPYVGVTLRNCYRCDFSGITQNFNVGLRLEGLNGGSCYNFVHGVSTWNCVYGIELYANTGGWVNNNRFDANTTSNNSGIPNRDKAVAVHIFSAYGHANNCNLFEGDYMSANGSPAILIEKGQYNRFFFRNESGNTAILDNGAFNLFYGNYFSAVNPFDVKGGNINKNALTFLLDNYEKVADIDYQNVDIVAWKDTGAYYATGGNIVDCGVYFSGAFINVFYGNLPPLNLDGIPGGMGVFIDIRGMGSVIPYVEAYNNEDIRVWVYMFDSNKAIMNPNDGYIGNDLGGNLSIDTTNMRIVSGANSDKGFGIVNFAPTVRYIFVTASKAMKVLRVWAKKDNRNIPCITHFNDNVSYPYFEIKNTNIQTSKPRVGKRLYSTIDGAEYVCTAVTGGVETWTKNA